MAPVAEMTYFDSGTIEHLTYRVVAAKEYSDGSVGGGRSFRCYIRTWEYSRERRRGGFDIKPPSRPRCSLIAISRASILERVPVVTNRAYLIAPLSYIFVLGNFQLSRDAPKSEEKKRWEDQNPGRVIDHSDELARAGTKDGSFTRS